MKYSVVLFIVLCFSISSCDTTKTIQSPSPVVEMIQPIDKPEAPKNIILLIGDGMGLAQITAGMYSNNNTTALERFNSIGLQKTAASDNLVTDSAASATAFACGTKTFNGAIGVDSDTLPVKSILKFAQDNNMVTGLVASSTIVHATPASFFAHNKSRRNYEEIASEVVGSGVDFLVGGGKKFFDRRKKDERNLLAELTKDNYYVSHFADAELKDLNPNTDKKFIYLTSDKDPIPVSGGRDYLVDAANMAFDYLNAKSTEDGFFVMVEGSQIDWGGHANDAKYVISEFLEYNDIIHDAMDFAEQDGNTLVIVTADHETGGLAIQPESKMGDLVTAFTTGKHTAVMVPIFAYGPGAENFQGIYENTQIFEKMKMLLDLRNNK